MDSDTTLALVARGPASLGEWRLENVRHRPLQDNEVLVRMVASGICLADIHFGDVAPQGINPAIYYPRVLGHEGSGYVEETGSTVTSVKKGDPVLLSYASCMECYACADDHPAYCANMFDLNFIAQKGVYRCPGSKDYDIGGCFFGQSSFAGLAVVGESSVAGLRGVIQTPEQLALYAPLGCGIQTGTAAMLIVASIESGQDVAVIGVGGVGLSAIMASKMKNCRRIIAIDRTESRLELARTLGATHVINTTNKSVDLVASVQQITDGNGVHASLDTTGARELAHQSYEFLRNRGKLVQVGLARPEDKWEISMVDIMNTGKQILGCVQGDAIPQSYAFDMIKWHRDGELPIERIMEFYDIRDFEQALADMSSGVTVKPILLWPQKSP